MTLLAIFGLTGLLNIIVTIALLGLIVWLIETYIPMDALFKTIIRIVCAIVLIIWFINGANTGDWSIGL